MTQFIGISSKIKTIMSENWTSYKSKISANEDVQLFWVSFGSWQDDRTVEEIIEDIYKSRISTEREVHL